MSKQEFWHDDIGLLETYEKAYYRNISYVAWAQGKANFIAHTLALKNGFAKKGEKHEDYPKWEDPFGKEQKKKITTKNIDYEFKKQQLEINGWLFGK